jgi:hypothetical protein
MWDVSGLTKQQVGNLQRLHFGLSVDACPRPAVGACSRGWGGTWDVVMGIEKMTRDPPDLCKDAATGIPASARSADAAASF